MPIDSSMYFNVQAPDILGGIQQGMRMRDMLDERGRRQKAQAEEDAVKGAYQSGVKQNPDGSMSVDRNATLSALAKANPMKAMEQQKMYAMEDGQKRTAQMQQHKEQMDLMGKLAGSAVDQASWENALKTAQGMGLDVSKEPLQFNPYYAKQIQAQALSAKDQIDNHLKTIDQGLAKDRIGVDQQRLAFDKNKSDQEQDYKYAQLGLTKEMFDKNYAQKQAEADRQAGFSDQQIQLRQQELAQKKELALEAIKNKNGQGNKSVAKNHQEFLSRYSNIDGELTKLKNLVKDKGTFELTGSHENKLNQAIDSIAIDSAKMFDPESVARESEVAAFKKMLFSPGGIRGLFTQNSTAADVVDNYKTMLQERAARQAGFSKSDEFTAKVNEINQQSAPAPKGGDIVDGYVFMGGDPSNPASWKQTTSTAKGGR